MENIDKRGLPRYFTEYLNYKLGNIETIDKEIYKEVPNDLKEYIDCIVDGTEGVDLSKFSSYPVSFKEEIDEEIEESGGSKCKKPVASPAGGTYDSVQTVTLTCATDGATIYYTTDGSEPTSSSTEYTEAITVSANTTIKAIAVKEDLDDSDVMNASYIIEVIDYDVVAFSELDTYLKGKEANTKATPYKIKITGLVAENCDGGDDHTTIRIILEENSTKYVDLSPTTLVCESELSGSFQNCTNLIIPPQIPSGTTRMFSTFSYCTNMIIGPTIPEGVGYMDSAFYVCSSMKSIRLNNTATISYEDSEGYPFVDCNSVEAYYVKDNQAKTELTTFFDNNGDTESISKIVIDPIN